MGVQLLRLAPHPFRTCRYRATRGTAADCLVWRCRYLTAYGQQHGDGSERPGDALAAHEHGAVLLRQQTHQAKQTALQHGAERWGEQSFG